MHLLGPRSHKKDSLVIMDFSKPRLLIASSRAAHVTEVISTIRESVILVKYEYETSSLNLIKELITSTLISTVSRVNSIAFLTHCSETSIFICNSGQKFISVETIRTDEELRSFLIFLMTSAMTSGARRMDFFFSSSAHNTDGDPISTELQKFLQIPVRIWKDVTRPELSSRYNIGNLYFRIDELREKLSCKMTENPLLEGYEKIRTVGKGAFGTAVLYKKLSDDSMVVIKEINMVDLTAAERQMALNEVQVLSILHHENIVRYLGSFERDGTLMIEMEYADQGTLAQMLARRTRKMEEKLVILLFSQIVEAIRYMHNHNVLHRDLKTANVFLHKDNRIKVGDFGISKVMTTRIQAQTVLGTPYYISPEMCEGKQYDEKSDIWALGCILYEMACLQKTFEGSNLPALVNKIMAGYFTPIPSGYSRGLSELIHDILQRDPALRPTADDILQIRLPNILETLQNQNEPHAYSESAPDSSTAKSKEQRSVVYEMDITQGSECSFTPLPIPPRTRVTELAVSKTHVIVLTSERLVFAWGDGRKGALGNGKSDVWIQDPLCIDALKGKSINHVSAGDGFSVFLSDSGMVITCGDGTFGCLGHGDWDTVMRPRIIEKLLTVDVVLIACGTQHVAAVSVENQLYTWGRGCQGRLGLGREDDCCVPMLVTLPKESVITRLRCGADSTAIVTQDGTVWLCGSNYNNKLGLVKRKKWFLPRKGDHEVGKVLTLSKLSGIGCPIKDISMGPTHSSVLTHCSQIFTFGSNNDGQLGQAHTRKLFHGPCSVKFLDGKEVNMVKCGPDFTVASTTEHVLYLWGKSFGSTTQENEIASSLAGTRTDVYRSESYQSNDFSSQNPSPNLILVPREILALYASPSQVLRDETIFLGDVTPWRQKLLVVVNTTTPVPLINSSSFPSGRNRNSRNPTDGPDFDSIGPIPNWIKSELAQAEDDWIALGDSLAT